METATALGSSLVLALFFVWREIRRLVRDAAAARLEARTDDLTGLGNKRSYRERIGELQAAGGFSFVLFDVANLKALNAALGHEQADAVLRDIAQHVRAGDKLGDRIGGDEFFLALPGSTMAAGNIVRDRIEAAAGLTEIVPDVLGFIVGAAGEWLPGDDFAAKLTAADFELETRKAERKTALGLPLTRAETLAKVAA